MKIELEPTGAYVKNGNFDQYGALKSAGVKAAICFKEAKDGKPLSPQDVRDTEKDGTLIRRAIGTIFEDHTTPTEHQVVNLEITGLPKILCMVLNNQKQYTADERSLRYTEVEPNDFITDTEVELYRKWLKIFSDLLEKKMMWFYLKYNDNSEKRARSAIKKVAQENARYMVSVFMPTTTNYSVPWIQLNKILVYMQDIINDPKDRLEELLVPYFKEFIRKCIEKNVAITKDSLYKVLMSDDEVKDIVLKKFPEINTFKGSNELVYKNNKSIHLSLFANRNKFSGINSKNEYGYNILFNEYESWACFAQEHRHRTGEFEMLVPELFKCFIPKLILGDKALEQEWINDMMKVMDVYPQGQLIKVSRRMSVETMLKYIAQERSCERAQPEIDNLYTNIIIPTVYENLTSQAGYEDLANNVKPYVKKLRCQFPGYHCPSPCGHPGQSIK